MRRPITSVLAAMLIASCARPPVTLVTQKSTFRADGVSLDQVIVTLKQGARAPLALKIKQTIPQLSRAVVTVPEGATPEGFIQQLRRMPEIQGAEVDRAVTLDEVEVNDPDRPKQYALDKVLAEKAWEQTMGEGVKIAIMDSGVDLTHPEFAGKLLPGANFVEKNQPPQDDIGHGTHVAGIAAALADNHEGIAGLAPKAKILPVKVVGNYGGGKTSTMAAGIVWAADQGVDVINMSLGSYDPSDVLEKAVQYALAKNVVLVATMGNGSIERKRYPAAYPGMIAVGSTDKQDQRSDFSNYGDWITVSAPGTDIWSTFPTTPASMGSWVGYTKMSGTSMAAPLVTGLAALIRSQKKGATPAEVKDLIVKSADDVGDPGFDKYTGFGRINAARAMALLKGAK